MRWYTITGIVALALALLCALALAILFSLDLSRYKGDLEAAVSEATGREFAIAGTFEPRLSLSRPSLVAKDISFANAAWSKQPQMVEVAHFAVEIDLWSLLFAPIVVHKLELHDVRIRLETDPQQGANWELTSDEAPPQETTGESALVPVVIENLSLRNVELTDEQLTVRVDELGVHPGDTGLLDIELRAAVNNHPIVIDGQAGPFENLKQGRDVQFDLAGTLDTARLTTRGRVGTLATLGGLDLALQLGGDDLRAATDAWGLPPLGRGAWHLKAGATESARGVDLALEADLSKFDAQLLGYVDDLFAPDTLDIKASLAGPDLARLGKHWGVKDLPDKPFHAAGRLQHGGQRFEFSDVKAQVGDTVLTLQGTLGDPPDLTGTDFRFLLTGADLSEYSTLAGVRFADKPFRAEGRLVAAPGGIDVTDFSAAIAENRLTAQGRIGFAEGLVGTDLKLEARGPDLSAVPMVTAVADVAAEPFEVNGKLQITAQGYELGKFKAQLGGVGAQFDGLLGHAPGFDGTRIDFKVSGDSLTAVSTLAKMQEPLPEQDFEISGHLAGTPKRLILKPLTARSGASDLAGSLTLDLRDKPDLKGDLAAKHLDLAALAGAQEAAPPGAQAPEAAESETETTGASRARVFSDQPLELSALNGANVNLRITVGRLETVTTFLTDVELGVKLRDGALRLEPLQATGRGGGRLTGKLALEPLADGYAISADLNSREVRLGMLSEDDEKLENQPASDVSLVFRGQGKSSHAIMSSSNGHLEIIQGKGRIANSKLGLLAADVLVEVFQALNPFANKEPYTMLQCGVYVIQITDGVAKLDPFAMETDKMLMIGKGSVHFATEKLDLNWTTKPREGIGLSATTLTNPYIKLGGTLASPALGIKPVHAAAATGAAVMTGGLSIIAQGVWDRVSAEQDLCEQAIAALKEDKQGGKPKQKKPAPEVLEELDADEGD